MKKTLYYMAIRRKKPFFAVATVDESVYGVLGEILFETNEKNDAIQYIHKLKGKRLNYYC